MTGPPPDHLHMIREKDPGQLSHDASVHAVFCPSCGKRVFVIHLPNWAPVDP
jgi:hypothetical protein